MSIRFTPRRETEPPPTKVEGFSGLERLRRTVGAFPTEVGGFKPDFWKMNFNGAAALDKGTFDRVTIGKL